MWYEPSAWADAVTSVMITYYLLNIFQGVFITLFVVGLLFLLGWGVRKFLAPVVLKG